MVKLTLGKALTCGTERWVHRVQCAWSRMRVDGLSTSSGHALYCLSFGSLKYFTFCSGHACTGRRPIVNPPLRALTRTRVSGRLDSCDGFVVEHSLSSRPNSHLGAGHFRWAIAGWREVGERKEKKVQPLLLS